jgi:AcrR family transcriptional regulator
MNEKNLKTEEKIMQAAVEVFLKKGKAGARMQEIADLAGINKALLHYYFRSKDKLFLAVFNIAIENFIPKIKEVIDSNISFDEKLRRFIDSYSEILINNQFLPLFILSELSHKPELIVSVLKAKGLNAEKIIALFENELKKAGKNIDPRHFIINMLSLIILPVVGRPMFQRILFNNNQKNYDKFLAERKEIVFQVIINLFK